MELTLGKTLNLKGYVTKKSFVWRKSSAQLEKILGYKAGRLCGGWALLYLSKKPKNSSWLELRGTTDLPNGGKDFWAELGRIPTREEKARREFGKSLGVDIIKAMEISNLSVSGTDRLCKVIPMDPPSGNKDYPPGSGAPQWELKKHCKFKVVALIRPDDTGWQTSDPS